MTRYVFRSVILVMSIGSLGTVTAMKKDPSKTAENEDLINKDAHDYRGVRRLALPQKGFDIRSLPLFDKFHEGKECTGPGIECAACRNLLVPGILAVLCPTAGEQPKTLPSEDSK